MSVKSDIIKDLFSTFKSHSNIFIISSNINIPINLVNDLKQYNLNRELKLYLSLSNTIKGYCIRSYTHLITNNLFKLSSSKASNNVKNTILTRVLFMNSLYMAMHSVYSIDLNINDITDSDMKLVSINIQNMKPTYIDF